MPAKPIVSIKDFLNKMLLLFLFTVVQSLIGIGRIPLNHIYWATSNYCKKQVNRYWKYKVEARIL